MLKNMVMMKKIVNPFNYLPLRQALCWGVVAMILTAVFMWQLGLRATSLTQIDFGGGALWKVTVAQLLIWLLFSVVLCLGGMIFSKSKVRFTDVAAYNLFARIPFDISLLIFAVPTVKSVMGYAADGNLNAMMNHLGLLSAVGLVSMLFAAWYFYWSYKAFSVATNLKDGKGVAIFFAGYMICYAASGFILRLVA